MKWENLTAPEFAKAVKTTKGVCVVPLGVMEKHGEHLPLGTDTIVARYVVNRASAIEPAVVFPDYSFTQIYEAQHQPGTIAIRKELMFALLENVCDEIARNGLKKIILYSTHGGNFSLISFFTQCMLEKARDYVVYGARWVVLNEKEMSKRKKLARTSVDGHAGEKETSCMLVVAPDLVNLKAVNRRSGKDLARLSRLPPCVTGFDWYARFPDHCAGDGSFASIELGELYMNAAVNYLSQLIRAVKKDAVTPRLAREFYARRNPRESVPGIARKRRA